MGAIDWAGLRVVVTGGGSGIGLVLALGASARGARVWVSDIDPSRAEVAAAAIRSRGSVAEASGCDVGHPDEVQALADAAVAEFGGVDVVFANAGVGLQGRLEDVAPADADWVASVNLFGPINTARAFVPLLRTAAGDGRTARFVITGSEHSLGIPTIGARNVYTASKHAMLGVADVLRTDLDGSGVGVALLCPGLVATNIYDAKAVRAERFGGPAAAPAETSAMAKAYMRANGQDPDLTAQLCFEGLDRGDFLIITDADVGRFARPRLAEIERALTIIEQRLPPSGP